VDGLVHVMVYRCKRAGEARDGPVRIQRVGIVGSANAQRPSEPRGELPGVLGVEIQIQEVVWLRIGEWKGFRRGGCHAMDRLRQGGVGDEGDGSDAEVVVVEAEDPRIDSEAEIVSADGPGKVVV